MRSTSIRTFRNFGAATPHRPKIVFICFLALLSAACTTTRTLYPEQTQTMEILQPGNKVRVYLRDSRELFLVLSTWNGNQLIGQDQAGETHVIDRADIVQLQLNSTSTGKTIALIGGIALTAVLIYALANMDEIAAPALCC